MEIRKAASRRPLRDEHASDNFENWSTLFIKAIVLPFSVEHRSGYNADWMWEEQEWYYLEDDLNLDLLHSSLFSIVYNTKNRNGMRCSLRRVVPIYQPLLQKQPRKADRAL